MAISFRNTALATTLACFLIIFFTQQVNAINAIAISEDSSPSPTNSIYQFANKCYAIYVSENGSFLSSDNQQISFSKRPIESAIKFTMRPSALGVYLLYDQNKQYLITEGNTLSFVSELESEMLLDMPEKDYLLTPAEWQLYPNISDMNVFHLKNIKANAWLTLNGVSTNQNDAISLTFKPSTGCTTFPESDTNSSGKITKTQFSDGTLFGFIDAHEHSGANHGFGGKVFHGASFHKLGIEHALGDCEKHHGENGSKDLMAIMYKSGSGKVSGKTFAKNIYSHVFNDKPDHSTDGYPALTDWSIHRAATHQSLYYKWIERAYLGGMRMMVEYMESTEVLCETYKDLFPSNSEAKSCNEMEHVDHQLVKIKELQDYVDAQNGGPDKGWFRLVYSPEEAREVIKAGKLAVVIGIEIENPFNCFVNKREGFERCNDELLRERLNTYYDKGVRALFPSHKFVNALSSGDGNPGVLEVVDYRNTGKWGDYVACEDVPGVLFHEIPWRRWIS